MLLSLLTRLTGPFTAATLPSREESPALDTSLVVPKTRRDASVSFSRQLIEEISVLRPSGITFELSGRTLSIKTEGNQLALKAIENPQILEQLTAISRIAKSEKFTLEIPISEEKIGSAVEAIKNLKREGFAVAFREEGIFVDLKGKEIGDVHRAFSEFSALRSAARRNHFAFLPLENTTSPSLAEAFELTSVRNVIFLLDAPVTEEKVKSTVEAVNNLNAKGFAVTFNENGIFVDLKDKEIGEIPAVFSDLLTLRSLARRNGFAFLPAEGTASPNLVNALKVTATWDVLFPTLRDS